MRNPKEHTLSSCVTYICQVLLEEEPFYNLFHENHD